MLIKALRGRQHPSSCGCRGRTRSLPMCWGQCWDCRRFLAAWVPGCPLIWNLMPHVGRRTGDGVRLLLSVSSLIICGLPLPSRPPQLWISTTGHRSNHAPPPKSPYLHLPPLQGFQLSHLWLSVAPGLSWAIASQEALLLSFPGSCDAHIRPQASGTKRCRHIQSGGQQGLSASEERRRGLREKMPPPPELPSSCAQTLASLDNCP